MRRTFGVLLAVAMLLTLVGVPAASADGHVADVQIVHGIGGVRVDVCAGPAGGELSKIERDFRFGEVLYLELPEGDYDATVVLRKDDCDDAVLSLDDAFIPGGANLDVVAHLDAGGAPTLSVFENNTRTLAVGRSDVVVRHTAAAPAVDVWFAKGGWDINRARTFFAGVPNGAGGSKLINADTWGAAVTVAGTTAPIVIGPVDLDLSQDQLSYIMYAVNDKRGDLTVLLHTLDRS